MAGYKADYLRQAFLKLLFHGTGITSIADNASSSPLTELWISLHTADPTTTGTQANSECTYGSYARQSVPRDSSGFTVTDNAVAFVAEVDFPVCTDGTVQTATWMGIGVASSGSTDLLWAGPLSPAIPISSGFTAPGIKAATTFLTET